VEGISKWQGGTWLVGGKGVVESHLGIGEKSAERGKLRPRSPFIGEGETEREEVTMVPHVGDGRPMACRSGGTTVR
jgi:hypothetical protein